MAVYYLDTSALVKRYALEDGTTWIIGFRTDWQEQYQIVEVSAGVADRAMALAEQHGLRGYDAVHLAAALELQAVRQSMELSPLTFVSADDGQLRAAIAEGLLVENPNLYS